MQIAITGANGHLGRKLIKALNHQHPEFDIKALVRSERAAAQIEADDLSVQVSLVSYTDAESLAEALQGVSVVVHLVGIIKESRGNPFEVAHEKACEALVAATTAEQSVVCLGVIGSSPDSSNTCFLSRAAADQILLSGPAKATVLRVPMVLGPDDYASMSLRKKAVAKLSFAFRAASLEQPIYSGDVIRALICLIEGKGRSGIVQLAGPESLSRADLVRRAAQLKGNRPMVISLPLFIGTTLAWLFEALLANPPVTRAMLGVLDHDDDIDVREVCHELDLELTGLDETLRICLEGGS